MLKVINVGVRGIHADAPLTQDRRTHTPRANKRGALRHGIRHDSVQAPQWRLDENAALTVLTLENTATQILTIAVFHQAQLLIVSGVDDNAVSLEVGGVAHHVDSAVEIIRPVGESRACQRLDAGTVGDAAQVTT